MVATPILMITYHKNNASKHAALTQSINSFKVKLMINAYKVTNNK